MFADEWQTAIHNRVRGAVQLEGILGAAARHHLARPGKQVRGQLAARVATSLGVASEASIGLGVACELLHNASLVHDDIQDGDVLRRGRETVWVRFGQPVAINLGDHLLASSFGTLAELPVPGAHRARLVALFARATSYVARGQSDEILRREDHALDKDRYESLARDKTGYFLALPLEGAAILAGLGAADALALREGGLLLGTAYQLADDVADLLDQKHRGEAGADLREGKLTWPILDYLETVPTRAREDLCTLLAASDRRTLDIQPWVSSIRESGAVERTTARIRDLIAGALIRWRALPTACAKLLRTESQRLTERLPKPAAVRAARGVAAEIAR